ncbi:MAG TPA: YncE family protein [Chitinophagaceae bacterium]|nr:YncE family protein [Chitinophagaceae bacterium]
MKKILIICLTVAAIKTNVSAQASGYYMADSFHIASSGGWDYIAVNKNKLYVSHGTQVNILDKKTGDSLGIIPNTTGVHGIAFDNELNKGYTSNGRLNNVTVFDLTTNNVLTQIPTGNNPDAILFDDYSKRIITCNGRSNSLTVIDPATDKVLDTVALSGKPETAVSDGKGKVFVNIETKSSISEVDIGKYKVENTWSVAPGESPSGLAIDRKTGRLFAGCDNKMLIVLDVTSGKVIGTPAIGDGCDGTAFDPQLNYIYSSNGDGTLTIIKENSKDKFEVVENITTKRGARTIGLDSETHTVYLPTANFKPAEPGERRPPMVPGSFQVLVVKKK